MGCQSDVYIGDNLIFGIATHDPDTGELTDADAAPIYRIYEEETAVPILTGTMTALDGGSTTGFYTELIACTAANGFEDRLTYTIYIEATVDGDTGGITYSFRAIEPVSSRTAVDWTYTVTSSVTGFPVPGVRVWISRNTAGTDVIWQGDTDTFGVARDDNGNLPRLDPGTYYIFKFRVGWTDDNLPYDTEVVT